MVIADKAFEAEKEKISIPLADKIVDIDFVANNISRTRQASVEFNNSVQKPIFAQALYFQINAQIRAQKKIRLTGFNRDAYRCAAAVEVPCAGQYIMFRHQAAGAQGSFFTLQLNDAVYKHEGFVRQAHPDVISVDDRKFRA